MENPNKSRYRLKEKYNNIPLEFGSNIFVNSLNLTDEYAEILLKTHKKEDLFDVYPTEDTPKKTKKSAKKEVETTDVAPQKDAE